MTTTVLTKLVAGCWLLVASVYCWGWIGGSGSLVLAQEPQVIEVQPASPTGRFLLRRLNGWQLDGPVVEMSAERFTSHQPERGQLIGEYGLRDVAVGTYVRDGMTTGVEVFRMINFVAAYGAYSLERTSQAQRVSVGTEGALAADHLGFYKGEYYVRLGMREGPSDNSALLQLARSIDDQVSTRYSDIPVLIRHLPSEKLIPGSERFVAGPLALTRLLGRQDPYDVFLLASEAVEAAVAEYQLAGTTSPLLIVEYHTPQLAATAYQQVDASFRALPDAERAQRILKREGNYIIEARNVHDPQAMQAIVDRIEYTPQIRWLKKNPLEDLQPFESEPQISLIDFYLTAFGFIGVSLLVALTGGALLGTAIFFWRRWRRRLWPGFTDAGGMLRLNLDDIVLTPAEKESLKRLPGE